MVGYREKKLEIEFANQEKGNKQSAEIVLGNWSVFKSTGKVKKQHQQNYFECFLRRSVVSRIDRHIYTWKFLQ